jgi:hypothetical protein
MFFREKKSNAIEHSCRVIRPSDDLPSFPDPTDIPRLYLGGNAGQGGSSWRQEILLSLQSYPIQIIDPNPETFPNPTRDSDGHVELVQWQRAAIKASSIVVFWLDDRLANQASRVEAGYALGLGKIVFIGAGTRLLGRHHLALFSGGIIARSFDELKRLIIQYIQNERNHQL